jgi:hypothetical protein
MRATGLRRAEPFVLVGAGISADIGLPVTAELHAVIERLDPLYANLADLVFPGEPVDIERLFRVSAVFTDTHKSYKGLEKNFAMKQVNHSKGEYVCGIVHTNGIENYWSLLQRSIKGTQIHISSRHLDRYATEWTSPTTTATLATLGGCGSRLLGPLGAV